MSVAPQAAGGQLPPELLQLLQGGGGAPPGPPPDQGAPPGMDQLNQLLQSAPQDQGPPPDQGAPSAEGAPDFTSMSVPELVQHTADMLGAAIAKEKDPVDSAKLIQAHKLIYDVLGGRQKEQDAALGTSPAQKLIGRGGY